MAFTLSSHAALLDARSHPQPTFMKTRHVLPQKNTCGLIPSGPTQQPSGSRKLQNSTHLPAVPYPPAKNHLKADGTSKLGVAGALGFEPRLSVLETDVLPLTPCPSANLTRERRSAGRQVTLLTLYASLLTVISPLCEAHASDKTYRTYCAPTDPDHSSYFYSSNNFVACRSCRPNR